MSHNYTLYEHFHLHHPFGSIYEIFYRVTDVVFHKKLRKFLGQMAHNGILRRVEGLDEIVGGHCGGGSERPA